MRCECACECTLSALSCWGVRVLPLCSHHCSCNFSGQAAIAAVPSRPQPAAGIRRQPGVHCGGSEHLARGQQRHPWVRSCSGLLLWRCSGLLLCAAPCCLAARPAARPAEIIPCRTMHRHPGTPCAAAPPTSRSTCAAAGMTTASMVRLAFGQLCCRAAAMAVWLPALPLGCRHAVNSHLLRNVMPVTHFSLQWLSTWSARCSLCARGGVCAAACIQRTRRQRSKLTLGWCRCVWQRLGVLAACLSATAAVRF